MLLAVMYGGRCVKRLYLFLEILELVENVKRSRADERQAGNFHPLIRTAECRRMQRDALHMGRRETMPSGYNRGVIELDQCCFSGVISIKIY